MPMTTRSRTEVLVFQKPFRMKGVDRTLPAGKYNLVTEEELLEGLSFPAYRRVSTTILVPSERSASSIEMITVDPQDVSAAKDQDSVVD
jgi:hypothetical protein